MITNNICPTSQRMGTPGPPPGTHEILQHTSKYDVQRNAELERTVVKKESKRKHIAQGSGDIRTFFDHGGASQRREKVQGYTTLPTILDYLVGGGAACANSLPSDTETTVLDPRCIFADHSTFEGTSVRALIKLTAYRKEQKRLMADAIAQGRLDLAAVHNGLQLA